jgi:hypothetical protein
MQENLFPLYLTHVRFYYHLCLETFIAVSFHELS